MNDLRKFIPQDKFDTERAEAAISLGYPAIEPILPELMRWLRDMNWPVARVLAPFLVSIGSSMIPYIQGVMETDDDVWKYWMMEVFMKDSREIASAFRHELERVAYSPTEREIVEELNQKAQQVLGVHGWQKV